MTDLGSRFVAALAAKDTNRLVALFAYEVDFRGMTTRRFWEVDNPPNALHARDLLGASVGCRAKLDGTACESAPNGGGCGGGL